MKKTNLVMIGIDGGTFTFLTPMIEKGLMPNLEHLINHGSQGNLISTSPPITGPAWRTFATGCNPGLHGVIDFVKLNAETKSVELSDPNQINLPTIWSLLNEHGFRCGIMGVPMTFPAQPLDGFMLTGLMTPSKNSSYCYPLDLGNYLESNSLDWIFSEGESANPININEYISTVIKDMTSKVDTAVHLYQKELPELLVFIIGGSDPIQHQFTKIIINADHPQHNTILNFFKQLDIQLGRLLECGDKDTLYMVISDHGFGELKGFIHMNNWLLENNYLILKNDLFTKIKYLLHKLGFTQENMYTLVKNLGLDLRRKLNRGRVFSIAKKFFLSFNNVDWNKTKVYSLGHIGQIYIQKDILSDEEYESVKSQLIQDLKNFRHPTNNNLLIEKINLKEEIYHGPFTEEAPEIILQPKDFEYIAFGESEFASNKVIGPALHQGHHRLEGIFILKGPNVNKNITLSNHSIQDILPTILYAFDLPIPDYLDGRVIREAFQESYLEQSPEKIVHIDYLSFIKKKSGKISSEDENKVKQRLKDLGYTA